MTAAFVALLLFIFQRRNIGGFGDANRPLTYSLFVEQIENHNVRRGKLSKDTFTGEYIRKPPAVASDVFTVQLPSSPDALSRLEQLLLDNKVPFEYTRPILSEFTTGILFSVLLPVAFIGFLWFLFMRQAQSGGNQAISFGRSRAKQVSQSVPKITFEDVAGADEAKEELREIVEFLKDAKKFQAVGAKIPRGVLLLGPPGCGKTLLARAVAGEAGVPFFHISGSDFVEMFVGVGASRVRDLFETAKAHRPSLIFIDEIDAVGRQRGAGLGGGHDEREQTLNQLLVEMDGFDPNAGVILIAATNRPDVLDPALLRPGRFDRRVVVDAPDVRGRKEIIRVHLRGKPLEYDESDERYEQMVDELAQRTPGFTGADIANLVNEAAILAARRNQQRISIADFNESVDRVMMGPERKSRVLTPETRKRTAYHEAGHAIVGENIPEAHPVNKISILPRGMALGYTIAMPVEDRYTQRQAELEGSIAVLMAGRAAEMLVYGDMDTGAANDLDRSTDLARAMVCEYGMSEKLGPRRLGRRHGNPFLGRDIMEDRDYSEEVARTIDSEVRAIIERNYERAMKILSDKREQMDRVVARLMEKESIERAEFLAVMNGTEVPAGDQASLPPAGPGATTRPEAAPDAPGEVRLRPAAESA
ncbi:MAG: ATP-dependent metallopeptidase FtsH/Yme1/Tma family protein [Chthonomonadales bacterium]|nr:ATP-dependent metallopeptidase FtsH/Yme1/Tma family protein [Chthonomonadales bacterium]